MADNSFAGYDSVVNGLLSTLARYALRTGEMPPYLGKMMPTQDSLLMLAAKPSLTFDLRFTPKAFEQCYNHRWQTTKGDLTQKGDKEKPVDRDDDGPDCVRYAVQSGLYYHKKKSNTIKIADYKTMTQLKQAKKKYGEAEEKIRRRAYLGG